MPQRSLTVVIFFSLLFLGLVVARTSPQKVARSFSFVVVDKAQADEGENPGGDEGETDADGNLVGDGFPQVSPPIILLAPISGQTSVPTTVSELPIFTYLKGIGKWLATVVVGICVIWVLIAGFEIMLSGANSGLKDKGVSHMKWALIGLCIASFSGLILKLLNNMFFK